MNIRWSPTAISDLQSIRKHIAEDNRAAAMRIAERIKESIRRLRRFPLSGRSGRVSGTRELVIPGTPYIAAYMIRDDEIWIVAILHSRQSWPEGFPGRETTL